MAAMAVLILSVLFLGSFAQRVYGAEVQASGSCGKDLQWTLDDNGLLTISGSGPMSWDEDSCPWAEFSYRIRKVRMEPGVTTIARGAFQFMSDIWQVSIPDTVTTIEPEAFYCCDSLMRISIPKSVTSMEGSIAYCTSLTSIDVDPANPSYRSVDGILFSKDGKTLCIFPYGLYAERYEVPSGVEVLAKGSMNSASITELILPEGLVRIDDEAIRCSNLQTLCLPSTLREIGNYVLYSYDPLTIIFSSPEAIAAGIRIDFGNWDFFQSNCLIGGEPTVLHRLTLYAEKETMHYLVAEGYPVPDLPDDEPSEGVFKGWYYTNWDEGSRKDIYVKGGDLFTWEEDLQLWPQQYAAIPILLSACGGQLAGSRELFLTEENGYALTKMPETPARDGFRFLGWYTQPEGGTPVSLGMTFPDGGMFYARWEPFMTWGQRDADGSQYEAISLKKPSDLSDNVAAFSTERWAEAVSQVMIPESDGGFTCVAMRGNWLQACRYEPGGTLRSEKRIDLELPLYGGFFAGADRYYVVCGQENMEEDDAKEIVRVIFYDRDWNRAGAVSVKDCFTTIPFHAGSLRMAENGSVLIVHTCRQRYLTSDGLRHQSQLTIMIDTDKMRVINSLGQFQANHVSHSFNQFALADGESFALLDHGDAFPRSVVLNHLPAEDPGEYYDTDVAEMFIIPGATGANCTGVSVGGFERTAYGYVAAINSIDHSLVTRYTSYEMEGLVREERNALILTAEGSERDMPSVHVTALTDYVGKRLTAGTPYLVRLGPDLLCALWEEYWFRSGSATDFQALCYTFLNGSGTQISDVLRLKNARLSESCQPVVWGGRIAWFTDQSGRRTLHTLRVPSLDPGGSCAALLEAALSGGTLSLTAYSRLETANVLCAWYGSDGRMIRTDVASLHFGINECSFTGLTSGAVCRVYFLDKERRPLVPAVDI